MTKKKDNLEQAATVEQPAENLGAVDTASEATRRYITS